MCRITLNAAGKDFGGTVGESQFAKDLRREAQAQTALAAAAYEESVAGRAAAEEAVRHNEDLASSLEYFAAEQLKAQQEQNEAVRAHHFGIWRQETLNGRAYERWRELANPVVTEFESRWDSWEQAKAEDIAALQTVREEQSHDRFKLDSPLLKFSAFLTQNGSLGWWPVTLIAAVACGFLALIAWVSKYGATTADLSGPMLWATLILFLVITIGRLVVIPLGLLQRKRLARGREWVGSEVAAFTALLPRLWTTDSLWREVYSVAATVTSMPTEYVHFREEMLVSIPAAQPEPLDDEALPSEAVRTRSLLNSWRNRQGHAVEYS
ncbi:hypothetical protein AB0284_20300 [Pseudarthrobacter phenanthrenivorans]|uniref:hypothetical protein n=1 Tax=Pseudarthrobacter phenanthrenivorans TaxID=361575 RepID=UPI00344C7A60